MKPLQLVAWGFVVVMVDIRIDQLDLVHDLIGWVMILVGLAAVSRFSDWFKLAQLAAVVGLVAATGDLLDPPNGWLVNSLDYVAQSGLVFGTCSGIMAKVTDPSRRSTANTLRWVSLALDAVLLVMVVVMKAGGGAPGGAEILPLALIGLGVAVWFAVFTHGTKDLVPPRVRV